MRIIFKPCSFFPIVLISTYWNVNDEEELKLSISGKVLISTYWNVNIITFNRL